MLTAPAASQPLAGDARAWPARASQTPPPPILLPRGGRDRKRRPDFPNVPLLKEIYPELEFLVWFAVFAPPADRQEVRRGDEQDRPRARDAAAPFPLALSPNAGAPDELAALLRKDHERMGKLVGRLNLRTE